MSSPDVRKLVNRNLFALIDADDANERVMAEACTRCGAQPLGRCHNGMGAHSATHRARIRAAAEKYLREKEERQQAPTDAAAASTD